MLTIGTSLRRCIIRLPPSSCRLVPRSFHAYTWRYSTPPVLSGSTHEVEVKVNIGLDQHINLAIQQPPKPESAAPIIIYLHSGLPRETFPQPSTHELAIGANATIVRLDYRLSKTEPYPFPIHSVLAGYDWVLKNLLPAQYANTNSGIIEQGTPQIGVCGEFIGGSLATMLALTECHNGKRGAIRATAVGNPIVDWTALVDVEEEELEGSRLGGKALRPKSSSRKEKATSNIPLDSNESRSTYPPTLTTLRTLRSQSFRKPENHFDPFASPLLFFRTPRYAVPGAITTTEPVEAEYPLFPDEIPLEPKLVNVRLSHRTFPPTGSGLVLPRLRLEVGEGSVVREQAMELVELWRRSLRKRGEARQGLVGEDAVEVVERGAAGLWGEREMGEVGRWLGEVLRLGVD